MTNRDGQTSLLSINNNEISSRGPIYQTFHLQTSIVSKLKVIPSLEV